MLTKPLTKVLGRFTARVLLLMGFMAMLRVGQGATVNLTASDPTNQTSFNVAGRWSDGVAPAIGNDYVVNGFVLRTPSGGNTFTFGGNSLSITGGGSLTIKSNANNGTITVSNLILNNGGVFQNNTVGVWQRLAGSVTLGAGGGIFRVGLNDPTSNYGLTVSASITGAGGLNIFNSNTGTNVLTRVTNVALTGANNYTGGTTIGSLNAQPLVAIVEAGSSLGSGNVAVVGAANASAVSTTLRLDSNFSIGDGAILTLGDAVNTDWLLTLNFNGIETISGLVINGTTMAAGTYGLTGSGADFILTDFAPGQFNGLTAGILSVVPEPSTWALLISGACLVMIASSRKRKCVA